ncbi:hypothetical protein THAOC_37529 [Thalassiosira oceanica]|uniref:Uncharacterized protein n=1 Tax=Thalassiosira oceanica TaxID=159749 RepID=K0R5T3_THAOC|nr:hypothetical protein THAOC_37529 [Thalassiosira oceanica]|eukprot:EJK43976.1 hypothetical protein THAOC_37529 [Thalassiosira oceanica]
MYNHNTDLEKLEIAGENRKLKTALREVSADLAHETSQRKMYHAMADCQADMIAKLKAELEESQRRCATIEMRYSKLVDNLDKPVNNQLSRKTLY